MSKAKTLAKRVRQGRMPQQAPNARSVAYSVLTKVQEQDSYANLLLPHVLGGSELSTDDKRFVTDAVYGTLRWRGLLDAVIVSAHGRSLNSINKRLVNVLRLGAYQWLFMNGAEYAVVNESVKLAKKRAGQQTTGFVNAVMRKIVARTLDQWRETLSQESSYEDEAERLAVQYSHPAWIVRELAAAWNAGGYAPEPSVKESGVNEELEGLEGLEAMLAADNEAPAVTLCVRPSLADMDAVYDEVEALGGRVQRGELSPYALRVRGVNPQNLASVTEGRVGVEDEGSQLAALALALAPVEDADGVKGAEGTEDAAERGERWLDMCAGPGGKTALLASIAQEVGATLSANEPHEHRRELVRENLKAIDAGTLGEISGRDGREFGATFPGAFDRVLVDAPCSGLGALRRRPEARWRKTAESVQELASLQKELLNSALDATRSGGVVAYVTCSPVLAETRDIVSAVLSARSDASRLDVPSVLEELNSSIPLPASVDSASPRDMQLFENIHDTDQMFIALIRKI
ncbi:transcription antitermination factor NusB [Alloscardovia macacae]|uniref:NOL1/NOP2/sun family n=1 Tax=Alloscardovia macacae TaxID=1160091 RepID=A0A261F410_9BIFI|nr:transcription antitermination factor NusB [Alloscardovia macacae]OZG53656.1 NOL1/NOP2/sun family [Alloscardovia macacae]